MTRFAFLVLFILPAVVLAEDKKPDPKADLAAFKGKWKVASLTFDGNKTKVEADRTIMIDGTGFTAYTGNKKGRTVTFTIDPAASPKHIDLSFTEGDQKAAGLYVLDGDKLTVCYGEPGATRPKKLESKSGEKAFLLVLERVEP